MKDGCTCCTRVFFPMLIHVCETRALCRVCVCVCFRVLLSLFLLFHSSGCLSPPLHVHSNTCLDTALFLTVALRLCYATPVTPVCVLCAQRSSSSSSFFLPPCWCWCRFKCKVGMKEREYQSLSQPGGEMFHSEQIRINRVGYELGELSVLEKVSDL